MAAAMPLDLPGIESENDEICTIEATVVTGMETIAAEECLEKIQTKSMQARGRIIFDIRIDNIQQVFSLRSVDNIYVVMGDIKRFNFPKQKEEALLKLESVVNCLDWKKGLQVWQHVSGYDGPLLPPSFQQNLKEAKEKFETAASGDMPLPSQSNCDTTADCAADKNVEGCISTGDKMSAPTEEVSNNTPKNSTEVADTTDDDKLCVKKDTGETMDGDVKPAGGGEGNAAEQRLRFRVTCNRAGSHHSFGSPEAAGSFGSAIIDKFDWKADMTKFNVEVMLNISDEHVYAGIALTTASLHKRNIKYFGPTTLRSTIAYNMLRMAHISDGEVVCDPLCGGGSIPIEGAISWPKSLHICGDLHELAWNRTRQNLEAVNETNLEKGLKLLKIDIFKWDVCCLPLRDNSVDVFITDMPFGKRSGSKLDNRKLYPQALREMGRISRVGTGRAVILTQDKKNMIQTLQRMTWLWRNPKTLTVNIGGLAAGIFYLIRTTQVWR